MDFFFLLFAILILLVIILASGCYWSNSFKKQAAIGQNVETNLVQLQNQNLNLQIQNMRLELEKKDEELWKMRQNQGQQIHDGNSVDEAAEN